MRNNFTKGRFFWLLLAVLPQFAHSYFPSTVAPEFNLEQYKTCVVAANEIDQKFRKKIPSVIFHMDRNLVLRSSRIRLLQHNYKMVEARFQTDPKNSMNIHVLENAIVECERLSKEHTKQASALSLFFLFVALSAVGFVLLLTLRPFSTIFPSKSAKPTKAEDQDGKTDKSTTPQDRSGDLPSRTADRK